MDAGGTYGYVTLVTQVQSNATDTWQYGEDSAVGKGDGNTSDYRVVNRANVKVNGYQDQLTEVIPNPVTTIHKSVAEKEGKPVISVTKGEEVTYVIDWTNYLDEAAHVVIQDRRDPGEPYRGGHPRHNGPAR